jgi:capsid protein
MTGDLKDVNFTTGRLSNGNFYVEEDQIIEFEIVPILCHRVWNWFDQACLLAGLVRQSDTAIWTSQQRVSADPGREAEANKKKVRNGEWTPDDMVRAAGKDPETHWDEYGEQIKKIRERGITLDVDAGRIGGGGTAQKQENVVEEDE